MEGGAVRHPMNFPAKIELFLHSGFLGRRKFLSKYAKTAHSV
jgi:hypothetical protein